MRTVILFVIFLLIAPLWASARDISATELLGRIQQRFTADSAAQTVQDVQADFFQKASIASLNRTQTGRGTMAMAFDHRSNISRTLFRWVYALPNQQQVISDGKTLWVYLPDNNQVMVSEVNDKSYYSEDPLLFLRNLGQLSSHFAVKFAPMESSADVKPEYYQLLLTPLQPSVYIQSLQLEVPLWLGSAAQQPGFPLHSATIIDPTGNKTQLEFRNIKINQHLALDQFSFTVPAGVDVVNPADLTRDCK